MSNAASDVKVGDVVEFEVGSPVQVTEIEENWTDEPDPHPSLLKDYGKSLVFSCVYADALQATLPVSTFYIRRERSPLAGSRIVR